MECEIHRIYFLKAIDLDNSGRIQAMNLSLFSVSVSVSFLNYHEVRAIVVVEPPGYEKSLPYFAGPLLLKKT